MIAYNFENIVNIIQIAVSLVVLIRSFRFYNGREVPMTALFFTLGIISLIISDIYWVVYDLLRPEERMPFAANEFGEAAIFLLLASSITACFGDRLIRDIRIIAGGIFFTAASTCLWIGWSGEWLQDIITGFALGYFICVSLLALRTTEVLSKGWWITIAVMAAVLIIGEASLFVLDEGLKQPIDDSCYLLMFTILIIIFSKCIMSIWTGKSGEIIISLSFACYICAISNMYMSSGNWYNAALFAETLAVPMMLQGVSKEVLAE